MKTMNYLLAFALIFTVGSCSKETSVQDGENEELAAVEYKSRMDKEKEENQEKKEEDQEVYALDLEQYFVLGQIGKLENRKRTLVEDIEGGNRKLIPKMEATVNQLDDFYGKLNKILELTCAALRLRQIDLENQWENATDDSTKEKISEELFDISWKLMDCGNDVREYIVDPNKMVMMSFGSRCSPARDYKCKMPILQGKLLINVEDRLAKLTQPRLKTNDGEVISTGKIVGNHGELKGMAQIELEIKNMENGILEIGTEMGLIEVPIEIR